VFASEAVRIRELLLEAGQVSPLLNLGSSTWTFRTVEKPHIEAELFAPLRERGIAVDHCDLKAGEGVDISGDILDAALRGRLIGRGYRCVLLSNVLEHVRDRTAVAAACEDIVGPGGLILATVPASFPYHADPIDTLYRPEPADLAATFRRSQPRALESVTGPTYRQQTGSRGSTTLREVAATLVRLPLAPLRPRSYLSRMHRWFWYARPYRVSLALVVVR
jgi:hypothetical protein